MNSDSTNSPSGTNQGTSPSATAPNPNSGSNSPSVMSGPAYQDPIDDQNSGKKSVPQESVGFDQIEQPPASQATIQGSEVKLGQPVFNQTNQSTTTVVSADPGSMPAEDSVAPVVDRGPLPRSNDSALQRRRIARVTDDDEDLDGQESPLDALERILAEANEEKAKEKEEEDKKKKEEEEFKAQMAAKQAAYQQEAQQRIKEQEAALQAATAERQQVEQQLAAQGKADAHTANYVDEQFQINQLKHDKVDQS